MLDRPLEDLLSEARSLRLGPVVTERVARSFGAAPLAEPVNPPVDTAPLRRPEKLIRPGLALA